jgi:hypothetical protein
VVPALAAWPALLLAPAGGLTLLVAMLLLCYAVDHRTYPALGLQAWLPLRRVLTGVAMLSCGAAAGLLLVAS